MRRCLHQPVSGCLRPSKASIKQGKRCVGHPSLRQLAREPGSGIRPSTQSEVVRDHPEQLLYSHVRTGWPRADAISLRSTEDKYEAGCSRARCGGSPFCALHRRLVFSGPWSVPFSTRCQRGGALCPPCPIKAAVQAQRRARAGRMAVIWRRLGHRRRDDRLRRAGHQHYCFALHRHGRLRGTGSIQDVRQPITTTAIASSESWCEPPAPGI